ncbi:GNAT family N-acetyltransferase [Streptomyces sp. NPDC058439]|uniref:GNAT family N-acetyltransferase n=1 Tax=Streptomyces sp. NPDC058439 TaxID=3346500 RepID=UPI00365533D4
MTTPRLATPVDAGEIARLRSELILSQPLDASWITTGQDLLAARLQPGGDARAYVIDAPDGTLATCALGLVHCVLPAPRYPKGLAVRIQAVATDRAYQRRGYAKAALAALLEHLEQEGVTLYELYASDGSAPLYESIGFASNPALMRMTRFPEQSCREPEADSARLPPEQYAWTVPKSTGFACLYFTDEHDRPLQLRAIDSQTHPWQWPGGTTDPGERPWQTALRECHEETGIVFPGEPRLLASVFGLPGRQWPFSTAGCVFDGGRLTAEQIKTITLDPAEHDEVRVLPLEEWEALMPRRDYERLQTVAQARQTGTAAYFDTWDWDN